MAARTFAADAPGLGVAREEQEVNDAAGEVDYVLEEKLDDSNFEAEEMSFA